MSTPKYKRLDLSYSTYLPDSHPTSQRKRNTNKNTQYDEQRYTKKDMKSQRYSVLQPELVPHHKNCISNTLKLNLHSDTQQIYQKMNDLYLNRQAKLKLKNQQKQIKESICRKKKENILKNSYMNLISFKQSQTIRQKNPFQSSKFVFEDFDSFRQK